MKGIKSCLIAIYLLACSISSVCAEDDLINKITKLYNAGQITEAYKLAEKHLLEAEGDPAFDYLYGLAAIDSGHISQGVFALERILMLRPNDQRVRLELARGYFLLEQYDRARNEFTNVLDLDLPADVRVNINQFMDTIRLREAGYKTTTGMYVELGLGYDTNVSGSPSMAGYVDRWGVGTLSGSSLSEGDGYTSFAVGTNINHPLAPGVAVFGDVTVSQRNYEDISEFNIGLFDIRSGIVFSGDRGQLKIGMELHNYEVGSDRFREMLAINGQVSWQLDVQTQLTGFMQFADIEFLAEEHRDSWQQLGGVGIQSVFNGKYGGVERSRENLAFAKSKTDKDIYGLSIESQFTITPKLGFDFAIQLQENRYRDKDQSFLITREDEYRNYSFGVTYWPEKRWAMHTNLSYTEGGSNINIYRYYRSQAGISVRYEY